MSMPLPIAGSEPTSPRPGKWPAVDQRSTSPSSDAEIDESRLAEIYRQYFACVPAVTEELLCEMFRLRHQVYCVEHPFENPADNPDGLEIDEYDSISVHSVLVHRPTQLVAGAVRMILPGGLETPFHRALQASGGGSRGHETARATLKQAYRLRKFELARGEDRSPSVLPVRRLCDDPLFSDGRTVPLASSCEISRFAISKQFRRRLLENKWADSPLAGIPGLKPADERRIIPHLTLGLIGSLVRMSVEHGITHWCATMEPSLLRLLGKLGIHFTNAGPLIDYHGRRQPCFTEVDSMLKRCRAERPDVWEVITGDGAYWQNPAADRCPPASAVKEMDVHDQQALVAAYAASLNREH